MLFGGLAILSFFDLNIPETSTLHLFLLGDHLFGTRQLVVRLELPIKVPLVHAVLTVDLLNGLFVALSSHVLHMRVVDVTLHVVYRVLEVSVGRRSVAVQRLIDIARSILAHSHLLACCAVQKERLVDVQFGSRMPLKFTEAARASRATTRHRRSSITALIFCPVCVTERLVFSARSLRRQMLGLRGEELIELLELISLHSTGAQLHELLQLRLLATAADLESQEILHARIVQHCHVGASLSIASLERLSAVIAQLVEFGAGLSRLTEVIKHRLAISVERGRCLAGPGARRLSARSLTVTNIVLVVVVILGADVDGRPLILIINAADNAERFFAVLEDCGRAVTPHGYLALQIFGQLLVERSHASWLQRIDGTGSALMKWLPLIILLNSR